MNRVCEKSGTAFAVEDADLVFYEQVAPIFDGRKFPPALPRFSPEVRSMLRCLHRNERHLSKRSCDLSGKGFISMYPPAVPFPVYATDSFFSDKWNALDFGVAYRKDRPFYEQLEELYSRVPRLGIINKNCQNSDYCNYSYANKNCYLTFGSHYEEDCLHGAYSTQNRSCVDCFWLYKSELCCECMFCSGCYSSVHLNFCENCDSCFFSRDLKGCKHCLFCANLVHKEYCILNTQYPPDEYFRRLGSYRLDRASGIREAAEIYNRELPKRFPVRAVYQVQCENCRGSTLNNCRNLRDCFYSAGSEDCAYGQQVDNAFDSMDLNFIGYDRTELCCQVIGCLGLNRCISCNACWQGNDLYYCQYCYGCSNCIGCISLQQKSYCILNKQYNREDYEVLAAQIAGAMTAGGRWGEFFPPELSPFPYNESMAYELHPLPREEALKQGFYWRDEEAPAAGMKIAAAGSLPDAIDDVPDKVIETPIACAITGKPFKIVPQELGLYRLLHYPLPRISPLERQRERMRRRLPCKLWQRQCAKTGREMLSVYSPERPETVFSEEAYLEMVYSSENATASLSPQDKAGKQ